MPMEARERVGQSSDQKRSGTMCRFLLILLWVLAPFFTTRADDISGTVSYSGAQTGTIWVVAVLSANLQNHVLGLDGNDDWMSTTLNIDQGSGSPGVTMEAWVYPTNSVGHNNVISTDNGGWDWALHIKDGYWRVFTGAGNWDTGIPVDLYTWQHVAVVFEPGVGIRFYKNDQEGSYGAIYYDGSDHNVAIGRSPGYGYPFGGSIDDVRIWNTPRTSEEIVATKNRLLDGDEPGLLAYWTLEDGTGSRAQTGIMACFMGAWVR